jgi:hypothetical protein
MPPHESEPSEDFKAAAEAEHAELVKRIVERRQQADQLRTWADRAEALASEEERYIRELEGLIGIAPQMRIEALDLRLRGQRLTEVAVEILAREQEPGIPIHYKDWYRLLTAAGHNIAGKDPIANFLAHVTRAPEVERVAPRSGMYRLRVVA